MLALLLAVTPATLVVVAVGRSARQPFVGGGGDVVVDRRLRRRRDRAAAGVVAVADGQLPLGGRLVAVADDRDRHRLWGGSRSHVDDGFDLAIRPGAVDGTE